MKKIIKTLILLIYCINGIAQCTIKDISTNPSNPKNTELSSLFPLLRNPWLNTTHWENALSINNNASWSVPNLTQGSILYMVNPFGNGQPNDYSYLRNNLLPNPLQYSWQDGWELLWLNTGYYPNGDAIDTADVSRIPPTNASTSPANQSVPYFIVYNKYSGKLRIFANIFSELGQFDEVQTIFDYSSSPNVSGLFRNVQGYDLPLDRKTKTYAATTYNINPHNNTMWWSSDLPMAYDPCICHYGSTFEMNLRGFDVMDVSLYGRSLSTTQDLKNSNGLNHKDFLAAADIQGTSVSGGSLMYKSFDKMLNDYDKQLEDYNNKSKTYNNFSNTLKRSLITAATTAAAVGISQYTGSFIPVSGINEMLFRNTLKVERKFNKSYIPKKADTTRAESAANSIYDATKSQIGKAFDRVSYQLLGNMEEPQPPTMPTATFAEMRMSGKISEQSDIYITNFLTPGTTILNQSMLTAFNYPSYNKPLGLYALLETPRIKFYHNNKTAVFKESEEFIDESKGVDDLDRYWWKEKWDREYEINFKLNESLKYLYNHDVDINYNRTNAYVLFQIELTSGDIVENVSLIPLRTGNFELLQGFDQTLQYTSNWYPLSNIMNTEFALKFNYISTIKRRLSGSVNDLPFGIRNKDRRKNHYEDVNQLPTTSDVEIKKIKMKVMTDIYFNPLSSDNKELNTVDVYTYLVYDKDANVDWIQEYNGYTNNKSDVHKYTPNEILIENVNITPTYKHVTSVVGNKIFIDAEKIFFKGNVTVGAGYEVEARAVDEIEVLPDAEISPNISMIIKEDMFNLPLVDEVNNTYLASYCAGQNKLYKANTAERVINNDTTIKTAKKQLEKPIYSTLYPNPTTDKAYVNIYNSEAASYTFKVMDITGKVIINESISSIANPKFEIDLSTQTNGIYIIAIFKGDELIKNHKIVKVN